MKKLLYSSLLFLFAAVVIFSVSSCQKNGASPSKNSSGTLTSTGFSSNQAIVLSSSGTDTIYAVNTCHHGDKADTIAFSSLPDTVGKYLASNYSGYKFKVAFKILDQSGTLEGYVIAITYNSNPVGLRFDANGLFVKVLEQREGHDLDGGLGWHEGGRFDNRDGHHRDTIALSALPSAITSYFTTNYPNDTLKHALINRDSSYVVLSADTGIFFTEFTSAGSFVKRLQVYLHVITRTSLEQASLPASITTYLTATYPAYVFDDAYSVSLNGTVKGYIVFIDANSTKYLVKFDASGTFVKSFAIR